MTLNITSIAQKLPHYLPPRHYGMTLLKQLLFLPLEAGTKTSKIKLNTHIKLKQHQILPVESTIEILGMSVLVDTFNIEVE